MKEPKVIYTYWQSVDNKEMPYYLQMCVRTWYKNIPDLQLVVINNSNVNEFIGDDFDIEDFKKLPLAQRSDVLSVATLYKKGGVFMDVDTIITGDVSKILFDTNNILFSTFGTEHNNRIHLAVMWCHEKGNPVLGAWYAGICRGINNLPGKIEWDCMGNAIIDNILDSELYKGHYKIIDRTLSGNILESVYYSDEDAYKAYMRFWFGNNNLSEDAIVSSAKGNVISLHNSWTPDVYKNASVKQTLFADCTLSRLFRYLLK